MAEQPAEYIVCAEAAAKVESSAAAWKDMEMGVKALQAATEEAGTEMEAKGPAIAPMERKAPATRRVMAVISAPTALPLLHILQRYKLSFSR